MHDGIIQNTIAVFQTVFHDLHVTVSLHTIERLAVMIHHAMGGTARHFHTLEHIFDIFQPSDPIHCLAALFHDVVYCQVDQGFTPELFKILAAYLQEKEGDIFLTETIPGDDRRVLIIRDIFGFQAGQKLSPLGGLNEFSSALVMNKVLEGIIPEKACVQVTVCIEATIPFRGKNQRSESWADILEQRLRRSNDQYNLSLSSGEIEDAIKRAVIFANSDVANFAEHDVRKFLDNTWKLLPETNSALRSDEIYFIRDYRSALQKMEGFLGVLDPDAIFTRYRGVPAEQEFQQIVTLAHTNIAIAREYLGIKLLAIAIFDALAEMTGGDAPIALFMGDLRKEGEQVKRLEDFLPIEGSDVIDCSSPVMTLLNPGRTSETHFDMRSSPTSFFLYRKLGSAKIMQLLDDAKKMFMGKLDAQEFLNRIDRPVLSAIARASASMAATRREELLRYTLPNCSAGDSQTEFA